MVERNFIEKRLDEIFDFSITSNGAILTKKFVNIHKGDIPVYGSTMDPKEASYGYIKDNVKGIKYFQDCLTINRNGSAGFLFYRKNRFTINSDITPLIPFKEYKDQLDLNFLQLSIEPLTTRMFDHNRKAGKTGLSKIKIKIPAVFEDGKFNRFDAQLQKEIAERTLNVNLQRKELIELKNKLNNVILEIPNVFANSIEKPLYELFDEKSGNSKYTKSFCHKHKGEYEVFAGNTIDTFAKVDFCDYHGLNLTYTTDGEYAGTVQLLDGDYNIGGHRSILIRKNENLVIKYMYYMLLCVISKYKKDGSVPSVRWDDIKNTKVFIPIDGNGNYDIEAQNAVVEKYKKNDEYKYMLCEKLQNLIDVFVV